VRQGGLTTKVFAERFKMSHAQARYFILNRGVSRWSGPKPFFSPEEESLLVKYLIINATIGRGLSTEALCKVCGDYLSEMSTERQAAARALFNGKLTPGRSCVTCFLGRHPDLRKYRVGTLEEGWGRNARPEVVARWFGLLSLLYQDLKITSPRQVWNMDETHIHARTSAMTGRSEVIGEVGMTKPEVLLPPFASGAGSCTAAFCVSAAGVVDPYLLSSMAKPPSTASSQRRRRRASRRRRRSPRFLATRLWCGVAPLPDLTRSSLTLGRSILRLSRGPITHRRINFYPLTAPRYTSFQPAC